MAKKFEFTKRENIQDTSMILMMGKKEITIFEENTFMKNNGFDGVIRIQQKEFENINSKNKFYTHFNLQKSQHKVEEIYLLPKIVTRGYFKSDVDYKLPILDFENCYIGKCVEVKENVNYEKLKKEDFEFAMKHIIDISSLKKAIVERYSYSMPNLSKEEIISKGVSLTKLEIIGKFNGKFKINYIDYLDKKSKGSTRVGFGLGILAAAKINNNVVALTADLKPLLQLDKFEKEFQNNFYEFGISEQNMMSAAAGMCLNNKIPFVTSFAVFNPGRHWDQLRVSVCYSNHNVKILGSHAGLTTGPDGATHQALEDIAITRVLPNLTVIVPCDEEEARKATLESAKYKGPVYLRVSREKSLNITNQTSEFKIGKANVLDDGSDVTIIACGLTVQFALEAKEILLKEQIDAAVINLHTIKPIDEKIILEYAKKTKKIVTIEEHQKAGGMGSAISEYLAENYPIPIEIIGVEDSFGESGEGYELLKKYKISTEEIVKRVKKIMKR